MTVPPGVRLRPSPDVIAQRMGDQVVVVHMRTNRIYDLSPTAARLWDLLSVEQTLGDIRAQLLREYDVEAATLDSEIEAAIASMQAQELLVVQHDD